jgi:tetratricopeptide (TPR) repeat protein
VKKKKKEKRGVVLAGMETKDLTRVLNTAGEGGGFPTGNRDAGLQNEPLDSAGYYERGLGYLKVGDYQRAIDDYTAAIRINPFFIEARRNRASAYGTKGKMYSALADEDLKRATATGFEATGGMQYVFREMAMAGRN